MNFLSYVPPSAYDSMIPKSVTSTEPIDTKASSVGSSSDTSFGSRAAIEQQLIRSNFKLMFEVVLVLCSNENLQRKQASINLKSYKSSETERKHQPPRREISSSPKETKKEQDSKFKSPKSTKKVPNRGSPYSVAPVQEEVLASRVLRKLANLGNFLSKFYSDLEIKIFEC